MAQTLLDFKPFLSHPAAARLERKFQKQIALIEAKQEV
jgi:hypothetical protein